jgi:hypothetical protein
MMRSAHRQRGGIDPTLHPLAPAAYRIRAMVEGVDQLAHAMLRLLVADALRARFDEQRDRFDAAIACDDEHYVRIHAEGMRRAWQALDAAAASDGAQILAPEIWECVLPETGEVVGVARTESEAHHEAERLRVFTLPEIAKLIEALGDTVLEIKRQFPGAAINTITRKKPFDWARGDEIPF